MRKGRRNLLVDYVPPVTAFLAAVAAVVGSQKWDPAAPGLSKITSFGWLVLGIGLLALIASVLTTSRNKREQATQKQTKERIASIGASQLLQAFHHAVHSITASWIWRQQCEAPKSPSDMLDSRRREVLASLDLNSASPYADGSFEEIRWFSMIERAAREGTDEIVTTLQIYASYLSPEIMEATTKLLYSDFLRFRLRSISEIVLANTHRDPNRPVPFFWAAKDEMHGQDYEGFWLALEEAMRLCGASTDDDGRPTFN